MSAPRCAICHDSGSKNQTGDYLDCPACDMPMIRKALNDFVKSLGPTHPEDVALAIHQRALAMAPKQEADHINDVVKMVAPAAANGAQYLTRVADFLADAVGGYSGGLADRVEEVVKQLRLDAGCGACGDACKGMTCRLQDESPVAAAGPDAALIKALEQIASIEDKMVGGDWEEIDEARIIARAALSGAKGN